VMFCSGSMTQFDSITNLNSGSRREFSPAAVAMRAQ
jgi:hypothetical protein